MEEWSCCCGCWVVDLRLLGSLQVYSHAATTLRDGGRSGCSQCPGAPEEKNGGINCQFHDGGGDHAADHGCGDAFHHVGAGAVAPKNWGQARDDDAGGHGFWAHALDGAM